MIVIKVGGSLYDLPDLRERLTSFLANLNDEVLIVPGGGVAADAVREWDRIHTLGDEASHWLAVRSMDLAGLFLSTLHPQLQILQVEPFLREHDTLPHTWNVTSDSIAAHVAGIMNASRLILLKSVSASHWRDSGVVDDYFHSVVEKYHYDISIVNLRNDSQAHP